MTRPEHLPNFNNPPVDEVVVGVQFGAHQGLSSVNFGEVFSIFRTEYPIVQEHVALDPQFETFGGGGQGQTVQFNFGNLPVQNRLWFITEDQNQLVQFQKDRLLSNWRKRTGGANYPRFETILSSFEERFGQLSDYYSASFSHSLSINQAEVTYINIIPVQNHTELGEWISFFSKSSLNIEGIASNFNEVLKDSNQQPFARLYYEIQSVASMDAKKKKAIRLMLTVRGAPDSDTLDSAINFLKFGRETIVTRFTEITTPQAHKFWEKT